MKERRKRLVGVVTSDKMDKTVVVRVERTYRHPLYKKVVRDATKYMAHDEENACRLGDRVQIVESRPLSRRKRWAVEEVLERAA
ncbi:MAG: 30S ribosomal protein S17 [Anaerolineales bacterium]